MEVKKTAKADLESKKTLFFSIGLVISLSLVVVAFEWKRYDTEKKDLITASSETFEQIFDVPPTEIPPPPPQTLMQPQIVEVPNDEQIKEEIEVTFDAEVTEDTRLQTVTIVETPKVVEEEEAVDEIFVVVEQPATPRLGMAAFYQEISENLKYPGMARRLGVEGKVFVEFVVNKDGKLVDVKAVKGIGAGCDEEAIRVVEEAAPWNPAKQRGRPVRQRMVLPITFRMKS